VTGDVFDVPTSGQIHLQFLDVDTTVRQGADIQTHPGFELGDCLEPLVRTWYHPDLPATVVYDYFAEDGLIRTCNVYEVVRGNRVQAERWTENAGMWIETVGDLDRIYHCSHGVPDSPVEFDALVYRLTVLERPGAGS